MCSRALINFEFLPVYRADGYQLSEIHRALEVVQHVVGARFHCINLNTAFVQPGGNAQPLHIDSWWFPPPQRVGAPPGQQLKVGSVTRALARTAAWHPVRSTSVARSW